MVSLGDQIWGIIRMTRPLTLLATFSSWFLGVAIAYGSGYEFSMASFLYGLVSMLLVSSSIHLINEYADYETDALTQRTHYNGGSGVLPSGLVSRSFALYSAIATMFIGYAIQGLAISQGLHPFISLRISIIGTIGGWIYSIPPRLAWKGLGEIWNTVLGAWLLPFYGFVQMSGVSDWSILVTVLPVTLFAFNNMLAVTWPDRDADRKVGKYTLATMESASILKTIHGGFTILSLVVLQRIELPSLVMYSSLLAYPLMFLGWNSYQVKEVSVETVWALYLLIVAQTVSWFYLGIV